MMKYSYFGLKGKHIQNQENCTMTNQRYSVNQHPVSTLFTWINSGEIAIPDIQRPFVWDSTKVRNLLDSLYLGFPIGYLIAWKNPDVKLKDGKPSTGKRILIDGQQRITALMAALLGREVINKDYKRSRILIGFHPIEKRFEVSNPAIAKDASWIADVSQIFDPKASMFEFVNSYCERNPGTAQDDIFRSLEALKAITANQIGLIELAPELDIETVTEIFIRVNSAGVPLSQADFAMSKIAVNESYGGNTLRKAIEYFCHLAVAPDFYRTMEADVEFRKSEFFQPMVWLKRENDDLYDPSYTDMLRVAFTSEFKRGRLEDLVALLSGRNFETKQYEETIVEDSFTRLKKGILHFINETDFKQFILMIGSQNALNFGYILYLTLRGQGVPKAEIEKWVRRWFVMSVLTGRYSASPESIFDFDIRQIYLQGVEKYAEGLIRGELSDAFWNSALPQELDTSASSSPYFRVFLAAQVKSNDKGFLSKDIGIKELIEVKSDVHHIFPRAFLKKEGMSRGQYNQVANFVVAQSEINIAIGSKEPKAYFSHIEEQCNGGKKRYGNIVDHKDLKKNLQMNCIPAGMDSIRVEDYPRFLEERRKLMAKKMQAYFNSL
jgi:hypothetical protein